MEFCTKNTVVSNNGAAAAQEIGIAKQPEIYVDFFFYLHAFLTICKLIFETYNPFTVELSKTDSGDIKQQSNWRKNKRVEY